MEEVSSLHRVLENGIFRFQKLTLKDIDNTPILKVNAPHMQDEESCLFHRDIPTGDDYFTILHHTIARGLSGRRALPIVRFADGEYAFYNYDLGCNGLYQQAESMEAIRTAMPFHLKALKILAEQGKLAPLIFPGNIARDSKRLFSLLRSSKKDPSASTFLEFLFQNGIDLTSENYIPFYVVYAYLTSGDFIRLVDNKKVCILNSDFNRESCTNWFARFSSHPDLLFVETPAEYVATRWEAMKEVILKQISPDTDLCIVGAGIGSITVCVDVAQRFSIPAIDAGHVLNIMNGRQDKSGGPRLYTIWNK